MLDCAACLTEEASYSHGAVVHGWGVCCTFKARTLSCPDKLYCFRTLVLILLAVTGGSIAVGSNLGICYSQCVLEKDHF